MKCYYMDTLHTYRIPITHRASGIQADARSSRWGLGPRDTGQPLLAGNLSLNGWDCKISETNNVLILSFPSQFAGATFLYVPDPPDTHTPALFLPQSVLFYNQAAGSGLLGAETWLLFTDELLSGFTPEATPA